MKKKIGIKGLVSLDEVMAALPKERQEAIKARGVELLAKVEKRMALRELRKGKGV